MNAASGNRTRPLAIRMVLLSGPKTMPACFSSAPVSQEPDDHGGNGRLNHDPQASPPKYHRSVFADSIAALDQLKEIRFRCGARPRIEDNAVKRNAAEWRAANPRRFSTGAGWAERRCSCRPFYSIGHGVSKRKHPAAFSGGPGRIRLFEQSVSISACRRGPC